MHGKVVEKSRENTEELAFFVSLCFFLATLEYAIPKPLPFLRIGLANLPIIVALKKMKPAQIEVLLFCKVCTQAIISGTMFSYIFLFSITGTFAAGNSMLLFYYLCFRRNTISNIGLSLLGSFANTLSQIGLSYLILFGKNTLYIIPLLLISGCLSGLFLGIFVNKFEAESQWFKIYCGKHSDKAMSLKVINNYSTQIIKLKTTVDKLWIIKNVIRILFILALFLNIVFQQNIYIQWICVFIALFLSFMVNKRQKLLPSILIVLSVTVFSLFNPFGKVLFKIGTFSITAGALCMGLQRSGTLLGMVFVSRLVLKKNIPFPGRIGRFIETVLNIFAELTAFPLLLKGKKSIQSIDEKLLAVYG